MQERSRASWWKPLVDLSLGAEPGPVPITPEQRASYEYYAIIKPRNGSTPVDRSTIAIVPRSAVIDISAKGSQSRSVVTEGDGQFVATIPATGTYVICVDCPGCATAVITANPAHASKKWERQIVLEAEASLVITLLDAKELPMIGTTMTVQAAIADVEQSDAPGVCVIDKLPGGAPLRVSWKDPSGTPHVYDHPLELRIGERRSLLWGLSETHLIRGTLVDELGRPVSARSLWLMSANADRARYFTDIDRQGVKSIAISDSSGAFSFKMVARPRVGRSRPSNGQVGSDRTSGKPDRRKAGRPRNERDYTLVSRLVYTRPCSRLDCRA
jgi:hypothetical protein